LSSTDRIPIPEAISAVERNEAPPKTSDWSKTSDLVTSRCNSKPALQHECYSLVPSELHMRILTEEFRCAQRPCVQYIIITKNNSEANCRPNKQPSEMEFQSHTSTHKDANRPLQSTYSHNRFNSTYQGSSLVITDRQVPSNNPLQYWQQTAIAMNTHSNGQEPTAMQTSQHSGASPIYPIQRRCAPIVPGLRSRCSGTL